MKRIKELFIFMSISLVFSGFTKKDNENWKEKRVVLTGKILNFEKHQEHATVQFIFSDLFDRRKKYVAIINGDGIFKTEVLLNYPQDFYLNYGRLTTLFCSPGDSLYLEIDADIWNNQRDTKPIGQLHVRVTGGTTTKTNQDILRFLDELPQEKYIYINAQNAVKSKSADEFTEFISQRENDYRIFLKRFNSTNKTNKIFQKWADDRLKYESWNDLLRYTWEHPHYNKMARDSFSLPNTYFSFLKEYDMNDKNIFSTAHTDFVHEFFKYAFKTRKSSGENAKDNSEAKDPISGGGIIKNIKYNSSGFTQQLLLTNYFPLALKAHAIAEFEAFYDSSLVKNPYFTKRIQSEYDNLKVYLINQNTESANLTSIESDVTSDLIQTITSKYKGKVIYLDFWAPWCAPCMKEMPNSKEMQQYFKDKDVVFLFLASQTKEDSWKATIANKDLTGEHINLTEDQYNIFSSKFGIAGIPHYTLIDKAGSIILKNAPRPSDKENLKKEIEKLLK